VNQDSTVSPRFSDDRQWWWTGSEWVPASQAPHSPDVIPAAASSDELIGVSPEPSTSGAVRTATSGGLKAVGWLTDQAKKQGVQFKANREAAAAKAATERQTAQERAATWQAQYDAWVDEVQRECPMPLLKSRQPLPGGIQLMSDECLVGAAKHWGFSSDRLALTTHRLIWSHGRLTKDSQQLYLTDIRDVRYHKPLIGTGTLTVEAAAQHSMEGLVHMKHAQQFRDSLLSMVHYAKQRPQRVMVHSAATTAVSLPVPVAMTQAPADRFEQLTKLAALRDQGALTDDEFQSEKTKLLSS
jgi:hypothetical protein